MRKGGFVSSYAPVIITSNQFIKPSTFTLEGSGYGIYVDGKSTVQLEGTNKIDIKLTPLGLTSLMG